MSLTLLYKGKTTRFKYSISIKKLMTVVALVFGVLMISGRATQQADESVSRVQFAQAGLDAQKQEVEQLRQTTEQRVTGMMVKLADVQSELQRLNALGMRLVEQANLNPEEFNFSDVPPVGGLNYDAELTLPSSDTLLSSIDTMLVEIDDKSQQLLVLESLLMNHHIDEQRYLTGRPIKSGWLSSYYGIRKDPFSGLPAMHKGLDFAGKEGADVIATGAGLVTWSGERYGYGNLVEIDHGDGLITRYGHNKELNVKIGDVVTKGQVIAKMGSTGRSTGAHVHYEVIRAGQQQDPLPYVYRKNK
ncbi:peptidoglycan DD-metalloendopeptidase family protein [Aestuariibacter sp. AA17]|uniref:Peptidoglycan DD-metalloendopeptidase family protein n=1 Tax=Fluctibacter corallii TaxID=2984329 RepID=A0ABT3A888_9ALTE|nr:peptidoglycan DD-metalloendopeptidase family protein [Aestuariibacter sp. AA17]MCV2884894.1 peptidoglycan DD-metalloendopeptidase family protein [Aestuariibacter sp. AA17]